MSTQPENPPGNESFWGSLSCALAMIAWLVVILTWSWVFTRPRGTFHDMGAMTLTFVVLPLSFVAWIVGGPVALSLGGRAMKNASNSETAASERRIARVGIFLSRLLLWGGIAFLALSILANMFG